MHAKLKVEKCASERPDPLLSTAEAAEAARLADVAQARCSFVMMQSDKRVYSHRYQLFSLLSFQNTGTEFE